MTWQDHVANNNDVDTLLDTQLALNREILAKMNGMAHLITKQSYRVQMKTFEIRGPK